MSCSKKLFFLILFIPLLFSSCADIFHNVADVINFVNEQNSPDPKRIFIGGDFYYTSGGVPREAFAVISEEGFIEDGFLQDPNTGLTMGSPNLGVRSIKINNDYIYVAGLFSEYYDGAVADPNFKILQRYTLDGQFDSSYYPAGATSGITANPELYSIHVLDNNEVIAGGNFVTWYGASDLIKLSSDGMGNIGFTLTDGSPWIYALSTILGDSKLMVGGSISQLGPETGLFNFAAIDLSDNTVAPSSLFPFVANMTTTRINDFAEYSDGLYVVGTETAMFRGRLFKYNISESTVSENSVFNTSFQSNIDEVNLTGLNTVAIDSEGRIYIGGQFTNQVDDMSNVHENIMRILPTGEIDTSFNVDLADPLVVEVHTIEIQKNGKVLVGGRFTSVNGDSDFGGFVRLKDNGEIDWGFDKRDIPSGSIIYTIAIEEYPDDYAN